MSRVTHLYQVGVWGKLTKCGEWKAGHEAVTNAWEHVTCTNCKPQQRRLWHEELSDKEADRYERHIRGDL